MDAGHEAGRIGRARPFGDVARASLTSMLLACVAPQVWGQAPLAAGTGSVEFVATVKGPAPSFLNAQTVLSGSSSDGKERLEIKLSGSDLIVLREIQPCLRLSGRFPDALPPGAPHRITVRWNKASAAVALDGRKEDALEPSRVDRLPAFGSGRLAALSRDVDVRELAVDKLPAMAELASDQRFAAQVTCFDPRAAIKAAAVETYRGVELRGEADVTLRGQLKRWIAAMTPAMAEAVKTVALTRDGSETWRGLALADARAILLRPESIRDPSIFFHEGAHLLDGAHGWRDGQEWGERFMGLPAGSRSFSPGALGHMDAGAPGEQLADFVARARAETLGMAEGRLCGVEARCADKLQYLAGRGYVSESDARRLVDRQTTLATAAPATRKAPASAASTHSEPQPNPNYKTEPILPAADASGIDVVLDAKHFRPIDIYHDGGITVPPTWRGCKAEDVMNRLSKKRPSAIAAEPPLKGVGRLYGYFDLGTGKAKRHWFALDEYADGRIEMLLDMKGNGRLDEEPPRQNMGHFKNGGKGYATLIEFPLAALMDNPAWSGYFKLWFMSNPLEWAIAGFSKSSHTQLIGGIQLAGERYDLIVADSAFSDNDGDLTNDGICLRKPGQRATCYKDAETRAGIQVGGRRYAFNLRGR